VVGGLLKEDRLHISNNLSNLPQFNNRFHNKGNLQSKLDRVLWLELRRNKVQAKSGNMTNHGFLELINKVDLMEQATKRINSYTVFIQMELGQILN